MKTLPVAIAVLLTALLFIIVGEIKQQSEHQHEFQLVETREDVIIRQDTTSWNFIVSAPERGGVKFVHPKREEISIVFDGIYDLKPRMDILVCEHGKDQPNTMRYIVHARSISQIANADPREVWRPIFP